MCHEIIDTDAEGILNNEGTKKFPKKFNEKNITCKTQNFYVLLIFLLITIVLSYCIIVLLLVFTLI